jgi:DNA-binding CsgD family transcriptional regulator
MPRSCDQAHQAERLNAAERRVQAFELAKAGASYRAIGKRLGVSHAQAQRDVVSVLEELNTRSRAHAVDYRRLHLARLEDLLLAVWPAARQGDLASQAQALRILERESRLLGLDAPARVDVEQRIRVIAAELGLDPDAAVAEAARVLREARA